jgi:hypothetical protein
MYSLIFIESNIQPHPDITRDVNIVVSEPEPTLSYKEYLRAQKILKAKMKKEKLAELEVLEQELSEKLSTMEMYDEEDDYIDEDGNGDDDSNHHSR